MRMHLIYFQINVHCTYTLTSAASTWNWCRDLWTRPDMVNDNIGRKFFLFARASKRRRGGEREHTWNQPVSEGE